MFHCPYCGYILATPLEDGISSCLHCHRIFDSSPECRLLSVAWTVRRRNLTSDDLNTYRFLDPQQREVLTDCVINRGMSHDEFAKYIKNKVA